MKFIHTADLHLDTPFAGIKNDAETPNELWKKLRDAPYKSFEKIINDAIKQQVDFVLIVGDIFDSKNQSVKAISFFIEQMKRLEKADIPVMLSFGNHDFQPDEGKHFNFPSNVSIFPKQNQTYQLTLKNGKTVAITGFSYATQALATDMVQSFPVKAAVDYQIGMVHGEIGKSDENHYAPFSLSEMKNKGYDYWALGHIHKRSELNETPMIEYPGDIQGRHKNEPGEKGYLLIEEREGKLSKQFISTAEIIFDSLTINVSAEMQINEVVNQIFNVLKTADYAKLHLLNLIITAKDGDFNEEITQGMLYDILLNRVQQELAPQYQSLNAWIYEIKLNSIQKRSFINLDQSFWDEAQSGIFSKEKVADLASKLFVNDFIRDKFNNSDAMDEIRLKCEELIQTKIKGENSENEN